MFEDQADIGADDSKVGSHSGPRMSPSPRTREKGNASAATNSEVTTPAAAFCSHQQ